MKKLKDKFLENYLFYMKQASNRKHDQTVDFVKISKQTHMLNTLLVLGIEDKQLVQPLIEYNDIAVKLMAPLGGLGVKPPNSFKNFKDLFHGLIKAIPSMLKLISKIGLIQALTFTRPDLLLSSFIFNQQPYDGIRHHPELLHLVAEYFLLLNELLEGSVIDGNPRFSGENQGPLPALQKAVDASHITKAEALVTFAQLMVNMTSANGICNLVDRVRGGFWFWNSKFNQCLKSFWNNYFGELLFQNNTKGFWQMLCFLQSSIACLDYGKFWLGEALTELFEPIKLTIARNPTTYHVFLSRLFRILLQFRPKVVCSKTNENKSKGVNSFKCVSSEKRQKLKKEVYKNHKISLK